MEITGLKTKSDLVVETIAKQGEKKDKYWND
jgi:hypothetical protein